MTLTGFESGAPEAEHFMELLMSEGAETVLSYQHSNWKKYAAVTRHAYGKGEAWYIGCMFEEKYLQQLFARILGENGIHAAAPEQFPVIVREGINEKGERIRFYLNYAWEEQKIKVSEKFSTVLGTADEEHRDVFLGSWDVCIIKIG